MPLLLFEKCHPSTYDIYIQDNVSKILDPKGLYSNKKAMQHKTQTLPFFRRRHTHLSFHCNNLNRMICEFWLKASINTDNNEQYLYISSTHGMCLCSNTVVIIHYEQIYLLGRELLAWVTVMWIIRACVSLVFKFGSYGFNSVSNTYSITSSDMHLEEHTILSITALHYLYLSLELIYSMPDEQEILSMTAHQNVHLSLELESC